MIKTEQPANSMEEQKFSPLVQTALDFEEETNKLISTNSRWWQVAEIDEEYDFGEQIQQALSDSGEFSRYTSLSSDDQEVISLGTSFKSSLEKAIEACSNLEKIYEKAKNSEEDLFILNEFRTVIAKTKEKLEKILSGGVNKPKRELKIKNIIFRLGNMFDPEILEGSEVIILPSSIDGSVSEKIHKAAEQLNIPPSTSNTLSAVTLFDLHAKRKVLYGGWAYSVASRSGSSNDAISLLCKNLLVQLADIKAEHINMPLLGTGAGKLDPVEIAGIYLKELTSSSFSFQFIVSINSASHLEKIMAKYKDYTENPKTGPDIKSRLLSDTFEFDEADVLNYDLIAENLFSILADKETNPPLNIGILAPWGRGKTSLMKRLQKKFDEASKKQLLEEKRTETKKSPTLSTLKKWLKTGDLGVRHNLPFATVWFNPWNYQSSDMIWAGLADAVIEQVVNQIPGKIDREIFWMQLSLSRIDRDELRKDIQTRFLLFIAQFIVWGVAAILTIAYFIMNRKAIALGVLGIGGALGMLTSIVSKLKPYGKTISEAFEKYTKSPKYVDKLGAFHEVQNDLNKVLDLCIDEEKPLVVFVDDLDRCSPAKVVEVIEAINVFINGKFNNKCYFILGMDAEMVAAALDVSYEKMKGKMGSKELEQGSVGWYFLDKFIQLPFFIPVMSEAKKEAYLENLLSEKIQSVIDATKTSTPDHAKVKELFDKVMNTDDSVQTSNAIKKAELTAEEKKELDKKILQNQVKSEEQNRQIKEQVSKYASFISSDPRSLKRFANLLRFHCSYQFLRMKKGEDYVEAKVLAKWLALMIKFPQLIRWIQWDSENKSAINSAAEEKAKILDKLISDFIIKNPKTLADQYKAWLGFASPVELNQNGQFITLNDLSEMPWLKSRNMYKLLTHECCDEAKFENALVCSVW